MALYDQFNREIPETTKAPETRSLPGAVQLLGSRDYVTDGLDPGTMAQLFKSADKGDVKRQAELFDLIEEKDAHLLCERDKRKNVILDLNWKLEPASDDAKDDKVCEFVRDWIDEQTDWEDNLVALQDAVGKGYSALEPFWDASEGQALPEKIEFIEQKRFRFMDADGNLSKIPLLITDDAPDGIEIPAWRTILHQYGGKSGHPARSGIFRVCAWMTLFKLYSIKDWVSFIEVFGMPLRLGKYNPNASPEDRQALMDALVSLGSDAAGIISNATEIEFVTSEAGKSSSNIYMDLASFCNAEMSKSMLGQTLTTQIGSSGSYAAAKTHNEVRLDLLKADGRAVASTIRSQLIRPIVGFNFGWETPVPKFTAKWKEEEDLVKTAEWLEKVTTFRSVPAAWVDQKFGIPEAEEGGEMVGGPQAAPTPEPTAAKQKVVAKQETGDAGDVIDIITNTALDETSMDEMLAPVKQLLDEVESLEEFRDRLLDVFAEMDPVAVGNAIERALILAELSGRFDVSEDEK